MRDVRKKVQINSEFIEELNGIDWFSNCGNTIPENLGLKVKSSEEAKKTIANLRWENIILDNQGDLTSQLSIRSCKGLGKEYQEWNKLVKEIKECYMPIWENTWNKALLKIELADKKVLDDVRFNILGLVMVDVYKDIVPITPFWEQLLEIYRLGYLPCGWKGRKDKGVFRVY